MFEEGLALAEQSNAPGMTYPFLMHLTILHAKAGEPTSAHSRCADFLKAFGASANPRFGFLCSMLQAHVALADGRLGAALDALGRSIEVAEALANAAYQRNARLLRARVHEDRHAFDAALEDAAAAPPVGRDAVLLVAEAVCASAELAAGKPAAARDRLRQALAAERLVDDHLHEARDLGRCVQAEALLGCDDRAGALTVLAEPCGAPALRARALAARLAAGDRSAKDEALRLLSSVRMAPLAELRLLRALAAGAAPSARPARERLAQLIAQLRNDPANAGLLDRWIEASAG
jgi:hypothetical protein